MAAPEAADAAPEAPAAKEAPPGEALAPTDEVVEKSPRERYLRFKELIGKGSYKEVWRAYDSVEGIEVAWNVVNLKNMPAHEKARVINEVRLLDRLDHENIIDFHGSWVNRDRGEVCFITEILSSGSLKRFIQRVQVVRWKIIKRWMRQILKALAYLHSRDPKIIHRDIKCDNIFINGASGDLRVGDLGLSTARAADDAASKGRSVLGTPEFMAPELYDEAYDEKVDVYAFGMCALEMITKQLPYAECRNATQIYKKVQADVPPDALALVPDERAAAFVRLCVRRDPAARPSASELLAHPFLVPDPAFGETEVKLLAPPRTLAPVAERAGASGAPSLDSAGSEDRSSPGRGPDGDRTAPPPPPPPPRPASHGAAPPPPPHRSESAQSLASSAALDSPARPASPRPPHDEEADDDAFIANMPSSETSMKDVENRVREGRRRREDDADAAAAAAATAREGRDAKPRRARDASSDSARSRASDRAPPKASTAGGGLSRASSAVSLDGAAVATDMGPPAPRAPRGGSSDPGGPPPRADSETSSSSRPPTPRVDAAGPDASLASSRAPSPVAGRPDRPLAGAPPPRFRMRPSTKPVGALSDGAVSVNILYAFDGVNHSVDFEYDVSEAPETVAVEFARECGYPAEEVAADVAEFLERVRRDVASRVDDGAGGAGADDPEAAEALREYERLTRRTQHIHEDRLGKLKSSRDACAAAQREALSKIDRDAKDLERRERDLENARAAHAADAERLARKFEKDMLDFEHKERIELANHRRRLDDFAARYRAAGAARRADRDRRAAADAARADAAPPEAPPEPSAPPLSPA